MKKILITGANSYIGTSFERYVKENFADEYSVDTVDMIDGTWRDKDFSGYDTVFHVAGIAHQKETKENAPLYYKVNRDLAIETAKKAKKEGVGQFIFLSTMSVYGMDTGVITKETLPAPTTNYGKSKWEAEQAIMSLSNEIFVVCVLRPPMVYGDGCKGNYQLLIKLAKVLPFCPTYKNEKSLITVGELCKFVKGCVDEKMAGEFRPQNREYVCTTDLIYNIMVDMGKKVTRTSLFNIFIKFAVVFTTKGKKAFGNLIYKE